MERWLRRLRVKMWTKHSCIYDSMKGTLWKVRHASDKKKYKSYFSPLNECENGRWRTHYLCSALTYCSNTFQNTWLMCFSRCYNNATSISGLHLVFLQLPRAASCLSFYPGGVYNQCYQFRAWSRGLPGQASVIRKQIKTRASGPLLHYITSISWSKTELISPGSHRDLPPEIIQRQHVLTCLFRCGRILINTATTWRVL